MQSKTQCKHTVVLCGGTAECVLSSAWQVSLAYAMEKEKATAHQARAWKASASHRLQHANQHSSNCHCEPVHSRSHAGSDILLCLAALSYSRKP